MIDEGRIIDALDRMLVRLIDAIDRNTDAILQLVDSQAGDQDDEEEQGHRSLSDV